MDGEEQVDIEKPVAYDVQGRPLYLHPDESTKKVRKSWNPLSVHFSRSLEPTQPYVSDVAKLKHDRSAQLYNGLNLSECEYVIRAVRRHPIGMFWPFFVGSVFILLFLVMLSNADVISKSLAASSLALSTADVFSLALLLIAFTVAMIYVFYYVFTRNRFYLTNQSIIQDIQYAMFSKREQTVSLAEVEDTSYLQSNIIQEMFNYGTIRLSTIGEEHTYKFTYVINPREYIATLNNAVEAFKNGLPIECDT
jgi:hypothetical protein